MLDMPCYLGTRFLITVIHSFSSVLTQLCTRGTLERKCKNILLFIIDSLISSKLLFDHRHSYCVRDISNNPNKPYYFATCGDDCTVKFWDIRKLDNPLLSRKDHSHWVWSVQYNAYHDQLVLSASSDSQV